MNTKRPVKLFLGTHLNNKQTTTKKNLLLTIIMNMYLSRQNICARSSF